MKYFPGEFNFFFRKIATKNYQINFIFNLLQTFTYFLHVSQNRSQLLGIKFCIGLLSKIYRINKTGSQDDKVLQKRRENVVEIQQTEIMRNKKLKLKKNPGYFWDLESLTPSSAQF
jgi:hypothetical protein